MNLRMALVAVMSVRAAGAHGAPVALTSDGMPKCCVVVGKEDAFKEPAIFNWAPMDTLLKWAAEDLATYFGKMSGATVLPT